MEKASYSPRLVIILLIACIVGQVITVNYLKNDFDNRLRECYEAINTGVIMQGALINILATKNIVDKEQLLKEAGNLSSNLNKIMERMQALQKDLKEPGKGETKSIGP